MSHSASKATLASLPLEVLRLIIPDPVRASYIKRDTTNDDVDSYSNKWLPRPNHGGHSKSITLDDCDSYRQKWLPITQKKLESTHPEMDPNELRGLLRSLSQTCRSLRAFALPLLWAVVHIHTIDELGRLNETLKVSPEIAMHIRSFKFSWNIHEPYGSLEGYDDDAGTLLDIAFCDRLKMWHDLREKHKYKIKNDFDEADPGTARRWIVHRGVEIDEPGHYPLRDLAQYTDERSRSFAAEFPYDDHAPHIDGSGPEGKGPDKLIKDAISFNKCVTQIVAQLTSLETFGWDTPVTPMPAGVFAALAKLSTLTSLHVEMSEYRGNVQMLPLWDLTRNLRNLSLQRSSLINTYDFKFWNSPEPFEEVAEEKLMSFELLVEPPTHVEAKRALLSAVASRTVVTAAKTGRLKSLTLDLESDEPFRVRSLLPCWVSMEDWSFYCQQTQGYGAALSLRAILAHASLWLDTTSGVGARDDRRLSRQDIQRLPAYFNEVGTPESVPTDDLTRKKAHPQPVEHYFPWLQDAQLAQQVAEAWNGVVQRGEADIIKCCCKDCRGPLRPDTGLGRR